MSHSSGTVTFSDGTILFFEYNGTVDCIASPALWDTLEDVEAYWRKGVKRECVCGNPPEIAEVNSGYGNGEAWGAPACKCCKVILDLRGPGDIALDRYEKHLGFGIPIGRNHSAPCGDSHCPHCGWK